MATFKKTNDEHIGQELLLRCSCFSPVHLAFFGTIKADNAGSPDDVYIEIKLDPYFGFWKRVLIAFRYLFRAGNLNKYEHGFADICLTPDDVKNLRDFCDDYIKRNEKFLK